MVPTFAPLSVRQRCVLARAGESRRQPPQTQRQHRAARRDPVSVDVPTQSTVACTAGDSLLRSVGRSPPLSVLERSLCVGSRRERLQRRVVQLLLSSGADANLLEKPSRSSAKGSKRRKEKAGGRSALMLLCASPLPSESLLLIVRSLTAPVITSPLCAFSPGNGCVCVPAPGRRNRGESESSVHRHGRHGARLLRRGHA